MCPNTKNTTRHHLPGFTTIPFPLQRLSPGTLQTGYRDAASIAVFIATLGPTLNPAPGGEAPALVSSLAVQQFFATAWAPGGPTDNRLRKVAFSFLFGGAPLGNAPHPGDAVWWEMLWNLGDNVPEWTRRFVAYAMLDGAARLYLAQPHGERAALWTEATAVCGELTTYA